MPKRGRAPTPAQRAALDAGQKKRREQIAAAKERGQMTAKERWAMLLSGQLTVKDLDDKEVEKMRVRGADGGFAGTRRAVPSHLIQQFQHEQMVRFNDRLRKALPVTAKVLLEILVDPEAKHADRLRAAQMLQDRILGKAPETVRITGGTEWDALFANAVDIDRDIKPEDVV